MMYLNAVVSNEQVEKTRYACVYKGPEVLFRFFPQVNDTAVDCGKKICQFPNIKIVVIKMLLIKGVFENVIFHL